MNHWFVIVGMAIITYVLRAAPLIASSGRVEAALARHLRHLPPALFAALIVPALLAPSGTMQGGVRLWAGLLGLAAGWRTKSIPVTIATGLAAYAFLRWVVP